MGIRHAIDIPKYFDYYQFSKFLVRLKDLCEELKNNPQNTKQEAIFNLSQTEYISVLGILLIKHSSEILRLNNCECKVYYGKPKKDSLMAWFLRAMGVVKDESSDNLQAYLDTIRVKINVCLNAKESLKAVNKLIPIIKSDIKPSDTVLKALNWALWEIVDNAGVHGYRAMGSMETDYKKPVYFCAFSYKDDIDIAVLDSGQGVYQSFVNSGKDKYKHIKNNEALALAIKDKESGHPEGSPGFGLFGCSEIARKANGKLVIISGDNTLILKGDKQAISSSCNFDGTMVSLTIPKNANIDLQSIFGEKSPIVIESTDDLVGDFNE